MHGWRLSLRAKITALLFLGMLLPLIAAMSVVALQDIATLRRDLSSDGKLVASIVAEYSASDLAFQDPEESASTLGRLAQLEDLRFVAAYDLRGELFSSYQPPAATREQVPQRLMGGAEASVRMEEEFLDVFQPVVHAGTRYGTLHLRTSTAPLEARIRALLVGFLLVALGVAALSLFLALFLQRFLSRPVLELAGVAHSVAQLGDYTVRARRRSEDEVGILAEAFNTMLAEVERRQKDAQEAIQVRDQFLSVASHELRTPLTPLKLQVHTLRKSLLSGQLASMGHERLSRHLDLAMRQIHRLENLVGNLLDVTRITQGKVHLERERMDLAELAREVIDRMKEEFERANTPAAEVKCEPVVGQWDRLKLDQVLTNLLSNALKYGAGKLIRLEVGEVGAGARLVVRDQGIGIAPEDRERIFGQFERAVSDRHYGGLGLGLFIVRQIVTAHGGSIRVESQTGGGSSFIVELPLGEDPPVA